MADILGTAGDESRLLGTPGNDVLKSFGGDDAVRGRGGDDTINAGAGDDTVFGGQGDDLIRGGTGDDIVKGNGNDDDVRGGNGDDSVWGNVGDDVLSGGKGDDKLLGRHGDDVMDGGAGDDFLVGDRGDDVMTGGSGADTFKFSGNRLGDDTITDFEIGVDTLLLNASDKVRFNLTTSDDGEDLLLEYINTKDNTITSILFEGLGDDALDATGLVEADILAFFNDMGVTMAPEIEIS